jgi:hypothetical protein
MVQISYFLTSRNGANIYLQYGIVYISSCVLLENENRVLCLYCWSISWGFIYLFVLAFISIFFCFY